ncbi:MAG: RDD family protein [Candidatus Eremiobacteraeota bacterium]|nr:RDD family protein [Candidatus Eremiobacteraeota bacterium]
MQPQMQNYKPVNKPDFAGYISQEAKKKFTTRVIIIIALFFMLSRGLPEGMRPFFAAKVEAIKYAETSRGTFQNDHIWYVEKNFEGNRAEDSVSYLKKFSVKGENESEKIAKIELKDPWLLAGKDRIWIISKNGWQEYFEGNLSEISGEDDFGGISKPFLYNGSPAVLDRRGEEVYISTLEDGKWKRDVKISLVDESGYAPSKIKEVQVLIHNNNLIVFHRREDKVNYATCQKSGDGFELSGNWENICKVGANWSAILYNSKPAVVVAQFKEFKALKNKNMKTQDVFLKSMQEIKKNLSGQDIAGFIKNGDKWEKFAGFKEKIVGSMGVFADNESGSLIVFSQLIPPSLRLVILEDGRMIKDRTFDRAFNLGSIGYIIIVFMIIITSIPFIVVFVISKWAENYRVTEFSCEAGNAPYASLWKRGIARFIDTLIYFAPVIVGQFFFSEIYKNPLNMISLEFILKFLFFFLAWLVWMFFMAIIMCFLEGKYGQTPGKMILGIKVIGADDMMPCGFLRAVLRYFCLYVDGIFSYMVGITVIAFTFRWQRVGDLAAKTVVVDLNK